MKKKIISGITALALLTGGVVGVGSFESPVEAAQATLKFKDVPTTHWAAAAINSAVEQGYFKGYTDGTFKPSSPVTKAEMASILGRLTEQPNASSSASNNFTDVPEWAKGGVSAAIQKGFINPASYKGKLDAKAALKRGEMAVWLTQGLATVDSDYKQALSDVKNTVIPAKEYFTGKLAASEKNAVAVAMGTGLMSVYSDKMFGSDRTTTRAEVAVLIARYTSVAKTKPTDFKGLNELRQVGLTGTNLSLITNYFKKTPEGKILLPANRKYDEVVTDDFSKVRNKEIVTDTNYADLKVSNWIIIDTSVANKERSIYYPVFVDEGVKLQSGKYFSFVEFNLSIKSNSMSQLQAGGLLNSATFNPLVSPRSKVFSLYGAPKTGDYIKDRVFAVKNPVYWAEGLLHFKESTARPVTLETTEGEVFSVSYTP
ncbi:S-layer homology domain-containing protein [Paenibacillus illinoisensis]|uniref:S-layer homology domain-containing protein n=1 Tax=Paenibacillus illinoisensis TaxID=59845 RepID=UPI001C8D8045|nr:S-layer homology domain-containing protein [Paenibacillus illinoisensis]MBY0217927.1 S-layer homology domain-containing protein [Paenibacillus illinoisensis]